VFFQEPADSEEPWVEALRCGKHTSQSQIKTILSQHPHRMLDISSTHWRSARRAQHTVAVLVAALLPVASARAVRMADRDNMVAGSRLST
jgi:hypothetical protein